MLKGLAREINMILGSEYGVFAEFSPRVNLSNETLARYDNIGVLYFNTGDIELLPGNQGLKGRAVLSMFMKITPTMQTSTPITTPLNALIDHSNGILQTDNGQDYKYVLYYDVPTSDGNVQLLGQNSYIQYDIGIDLVLSNSLMLGQEASFQLYNSTTSTWQNIDFISLTLLPNVELDTKMFLDGNADISDVLASKWGANLVVLYQPKNDLLKALYTNSQTAPQTRYQVRYSDDGGVTYITKTAVLHDCTYSFERGQFAVMNLNFAQAVT